MAFGEAFARVAGFGRAALQPAIWNDVGRPEWRSLAQPAGGYDPGVTSVDQPDLFVADIGDKTHAVQNPLSVSIAQKADSLAIVHLGGRIHVDERRLACLDVERPEFTCVHGRYGLPAESG